MQIQDFIEYVENYKLDNEYRIILQEKYLDRNLYLRIFIMYKEICLHMVLLTLKGNELKWYLTPYNGLYLEASAYDVKTYNMIILAIKEHTDIHMKNIINIT